ncbi:MAG: hypothetical protein R3195_08605 [Gemmatimonadota bacterium]|nr:hypothetical protein [Gemmatimonadota bacterium]
MSTAPDTTGAFSPEEMAELPEEAALAFLPLHKRALGIAFGVVGALLVFVATAFHLVFLEADPSGLRLLGEYFYGYRVSWTGAFIGAFWGFLTAFVFAWFAAFVRNLVIATYVFLARTRDEIRQTRDFLDHI